MALSFGQYPVVFGKQPVYALKLEENCYRRGNDSRKKCDHNTDYRPKQVLHEIQTLVHGLKSNVHLFLHRLEMYAGLSIKVGQLVTKIAKPVPVPKRERDGGVEARIVVFVRLFGILCES